jgi:hypothetical protein
MWRVFLVIVEAQTQQYFFVSFRIILETARFSRKNVED